MIRTFNNYYLKLFVLSIGMLFFSLTTKAQLGYNYFPFDVSVGGSINTVYGDTKSPVNTKTLNFSLTYNQTPFVNYVFETQVGHFAGGDELKDRLGRQFSNHYSAYLAKAQLQAGELIDYEDSPVANAFKNLYLSSGIGLIINNNVTNRYSFQIDQYSPGEDHSTEAFLPVRLGYEFKIFNSYDEPYVKLDLAYQYNYVFGDELDGFKAGNSNDIFTQLTVSIKFALGIKTSYRKQISY